MAGWAGTGGVVLGYGVVGLHCVEIAQVTAAAFTADLEIAVAVELGDFV